MALFLPRWRVLSPEGLDNIANHKYKPGKYTPLDNLMNPFWFHLAELLPRWLAPNLVTLAGFLPMATSYALMWQYSPADPAPRSLAIFTALALLFYQTMDAVDGKQARRTGSSTPLGQLFDHGCDCLACLSHHSVAGMVLLFGGTRWGVAGLASLQTGFFMAQWQEQYTGVLRTSFGPVGVTEMQYLLVSMALFAGFAGPERLQNWATTELQSPWGRAPEPVGILAAQAWVVFCGVLMVISAFKTLGEVTRAPVVPGELRPVFRAVLDMFPVVALNVLILLWEPSVLRRTPRLLCLLTGLLFFYYTAQMILFSMAGMRFPVWQQSLLPYAGLALFSRLASHWEASIDASLAVVTAAVGSMILLWLVNATEELKAKLGIYVFSISVHSVKKD